MPEQGTHTSGLAIASMVLGIVGLCGGWTLIIPLLAIIFGSIALSSINKDSQLSGKSMAITGLILGLLSLLGWIIYIIIFGFAFIAGMV